jgi:hypothetical protein
MSFICRANAQHIWSTHLGTFILREQLLPEFYLSCFMLERICSTHLGTTIKYKVLMSFIRRANARTHLEYIPWHLYFEGA